MPDSAAAERWIGGIRFSPSIETMPYLMSYWRYSSDIELGSSGTASYRKSRNPGP